MTIYTTTGTQFSKAGITVSYTDETGATATQNVTFANKVMSLDSGLNVTAGKADFAGAAEVHGAAQLDSTLDVTGASRLHNTVVVDGAASLGSSLAVAGAASLNSTLAVAGASNLNNTLAVSGAASLNSTLAVTGAANLNNTLAVSSATTLGSSLTVAGASQLNDTLAVTGAAALSSTLAVTGATTLNNVMTVAGAVSMASTLDVTGASHLHNNVVVDGTANMGSSLTVTGAASLSSSLAVTGAASLSSSLAVTGAANLNNTLAVSGAASLNNTLAVAGAASLNSSLAVTGAASLSSSLAVTGAANLNNTLAVLGPASLSNSLAVTGAASMANTLSVTGAATFQNNVTVNGNLTVLGSQTAIDTTSLQVKDNAILLADGNEADTISTGIQLQYKPSGASAVKYAGMKRLPATGEFVFFKDAVNKIEEPLTAEQQAAAAAAAAAAASASNPYTVLGNWIQIDVNGAAKKLGKYNIINSSGTGAPDNMYIIGSNNNGATWKLIHHQTSFVNSEVITTGDNADVAFAKIRFVIVNFQPAPQQVANGHGFGNYNQFNIMEPTGVAISHTVTSQANWPQPQEYHMAPNWSFNIWNSPGGYLYGYNTSNIYTGSMSTTITPNPSSASSAPAAPTDVYAVVIADGFNCASDARLKKDVVALDGALDKLDAIRGVKYNWVDAAQPQTRQVGVIAQEIQAVYPELVMEGGNGFLSVDYPKLTAVLLQSVKELKAMVVALANK